MVCVFGQRATYLRRSPLSHVQGKRLQSPRCTHRDFCCFHVLEFAQSAARVRSKSEILPPLGLPVLANPTVYAYAIRETSQSYLAARLVHQLGSSSSRLPDGTCFIHRDFTNCDQRWESTTTGAHHTTASMTNTHTEPLHHSRVPVGP